MSHTTVQNVSTTTGDDSEPTAHVGLSAPEGAESTQLPRSPRRWSRTLAIVGGAAAFVALSLVLVDLVTNDSSSTSAQFDQQIDRLDLDVANGDVVIIGTDDPGVTIEATVHGGIQTPHHDESVHDGVLDIDADCSLGPISPTCSIDYLVRIPTGVDIVARGSGTDYDLRDVTGDVDIALEGGDADMQFADTPRLVHARTDGGDIDITVPAHASHRVVASADGGSTHIDIATDPDSAYVIDAHANGGDITISRLRSSGRDAP